MNTAHPQTATNNHKTRRRRILLPSDIGRLVIFAVMLLIIVPTCAWLAGGFKHWQDVSWRFGLNLSLIALAPMATRIHLLVILALVITGWVMLALPKGDRRHKILGWTWVGTMVAMSVVSLAVPHSDSWVAAYAGGGSALVLMAVGIYFVKRHQLRNHGRTMVMLMIALVLMTLLSILPGRLMHDVLFSAKPFAASQTKTQSQSTALALPGVANTPAPSEQFPG
jgi:uncharacterized membrane protein